MSGLLESMVFEAHCIDALLKHLSSNINITLLWLSTAVLLQSITVLIGIPVSHLFVGSDRSRIINTNTSVLWLVHTNTPKPFNTRSSMHRFLKGYKNA
jgi:hypothetical protein